MAARLVRLLLMSCRFVLACYLVVFDVGLFRFETLSGLRSFETEFYENLVKSVMKVFY